MDEINGFLSSISDDQTNMIMIPHFSEASSCHDHHNYPSTDYFTAQLTATNFNPNHLTMGQDHSNNSMSAMREMIYRIAVMQPVHIDPESVKPPKRRNVKISKDPQSVAARRRRERISERIRILQRLVPGGTKMDTASMLDEAVLYLKFLKNQVQTLEKVGENRSPAAYQQSVQNVHDYLGA